MAVPEIIRPGDTIELTMDIPMVGPEWRKGYRVTVNRFYASGAMAPAEANARPMTAAGLLEDYVSVGSDDNRHHLSVDLPKELRPDNRVAGWKPHAVLVACASGRPIADLVAELRERPIYPNLAFAVPREAMRSILQLAPVPSVTAIMPAKQRTLTIYAIDAGPAGEVTIDCAPVAWHAPFTLAERRKPTGMYFTIHAVDPASVNQDVIMASGYNLPNVHGDSGGICWGLNQKPTTLKTAHLMFWGAPFNAHLSPLPRHDDLTCPFQNKPHKCAGRTNYERGGTGPLCKRQHKCPRCAPGSTDPHRCACPAAEWRYRSGGGADGHVGPTQECLAGPVEHRYQRAPEGSAPSTIRAYVRQRRHHLTPQEVRRYKVTLTNTFGEAVAGYCPCQCCRTTRNSGHGFATCRCHIGRCQCCDGRCQCHMTCECEMGGCNCRSGCDCCDGTCRCPRPEACRCDRNQDFAQVFKDWRPLPYKPHKAWRGDLYIDMRKSVDVLLCSSDTKVLAQVPAACKRKHGDHDMVLGYGRRQADGQYACVAVAPDGTETPLRLERAQLTFC